MNNSTREVISAVAGERGVEVAEPKFTPGPYTVNVARLSDNSINVAHVLGPKGQGLAQIGNYGEAETLANAALFAAAPDMYVQHCANAAILEYLVNAIDANEPLTVEMFDKIFACLKRSQSALAKARAA